MACIDYQITLYDQDGNFIKDLIDYEQFELTRIKNEIGTFTIVLPSVTHDITDFSCDYRAEVFRKGELVGDTCWFLQRKELVLDGLSEKITLTFADAVDILTRRVNAYLSCDSGEQCMGSLVDAADDMMKVLFKYNFTDLAASGGAAEAYPDTSLLTDPMDTQGIIPAVTSAYASIGETVLSGRTMPIQCDQYLQDGVVLTQEFSFTQVFEALQGIATASSAIPFDDLTHNIWFDIEYSPETLTQNSSFLFKTWVGIRGQDLRDEVSIGPTFGNLTNAVFVDDCSQKADIAYILSDDDVAGTVVWYAALDPTSNDYYYNLPFAPVEIVADLPNDNVDADQLEGEGLSLLGASAQTKSLSGDIVTSKYFDFMTHFNYGDLLTLTWGSISETVEIAEFTITVDSDGSEVINIPLVIL